MRYTIGVITSVPDPLEDDGNLANAVPLQEGADGKRARLLAVNLYEEVFQPGEILILDAEWGREVSGQGRKPGKWDVVCEHFDDMDTAIARALKVRQW